VLEHRFFLLRFRTFGNVGIPAGKNKTPINGQSRKAPEGATRCRVLTSGLVLSAPVGGSKSCHLSADARGKQEKAAGVKAPGPELSHCGRNRPLRTLSCRFRSGRVRDCGTCFRRSSAPDSRPRLPPRSRKSALC